MVKKINRRSRLSTSYKKGLTLIMRLHLKSIAIGFVSLLVWSSGALAQDAKLIEAAKREAAR